MASIDFDFSHIPVPFRMQPGLRRLGERDGHLTALRPGSALWEEKRAVLATRASRHVLADFDPLPALEAIRAQAAREGLPGPCEDLPLELAFEEDFAVLEGSDARLPWMCVCVPSHWAPEDKVGLPFAAVHAPVADNSVLLAASRQLVNLVCGGQRWERHVWSVTPSPCHDQHPHRHAREPWPSVQDPQDFASRCFFRAERQTFFPVGGGTQQAVFTIRVMLQPLPQTIDSPEKAVRLHDALASMSAAVLAYKGLDDARAPLLQWLRSRAA